MKKPEIESPEKSKRYIFWNIILGILSVGLVHGVFYLISLIAYGFDTAKWPFKNPISFIVGVVTSNTSSDKQDNIAGTKPKLQNAEDGQGNLRPQEDPGKDEQLRLQKKRQEEMEKKERELLEQQKRLQEEEDRKEREYLEQLQKQFQEESDEEEREMLTRFQDEFQKEYDEQERNAVLSGIEELKQKDELEFKRLQAAEKPSQSNNSVVQDEPVSDLKDAPVITQEKTNPLLVNTALHILIDTNQTDRALRYISYMDEKDLNVQSKGNTPLMLALKKGNLTVARALLDNPKIDVTVEDNSGLTALHWAAILRADDIIVKLLEAGAKLYDEVDSANAYDKEHPEALLKKTKSPRLLYQLNPIKAYFEKYLADSYSYFEIQKVYGENADFKKEKTPQVRKVEQEIEQFYGCEDPKFFTEGHKGIMSAIAYSELVLHIKDICLNMDWMTPAIEAGIRASKSEVSPSDVLRKLFSVCYTVFLEKRNKQAVNQEIQKALSGEKFKFTQEAPVRKNEFKFFGRRRFKEKFAKEVAEVMEFIHETSKIFSLEYDRIHQSEKRVVDQHLKLKNELIKRMVDSFYRLFFDYCAANNIETIVVCRGSYGHKEQQ